MHFTHDPEVLRSQLHPTTVESASCMTSFEAGKGKQWM